MRLDLEGLDVQFVRSGNHVRVEYGTSEENHAKFEWAFPDLRSCKIPKARALRFTKLSMAVILRFICSRLLAENSDKTVFFGHREDGGKAFIQKR